MDQKGSIVNLLKVVLSRLVRAMKPAESVSRRLSTTVKEKEQFYQIELVKAGVLHDQALKVSQILASRVPSGQLTSEEDEIVRQACRQWLEHRKRWHSVGRITNKVAPATSKLEKSYRYSNGKATPLAGRV